MLQKFLNEAKKGYGGVVINLGDGSSRLALDVNRVTRGGEPVKLYLTKQTRKVEKAWEILQ